MKDVSWSKPTKPDERDIDLAARKLASKVNPHDAHVGIGDEGLVLYVTRSKSIAKRLAVQITNQDGFPVHVEYIGQVRPA